MSITREFVEEGLVESINFIIPGTEDCAIEEILIDLWCANPRINGVNQCIKICTAHVVRELDCGIVDIVSGTNSNLQQPLSMLCIPLLKSHVPGEEVDLNVGPEFAPTQ